MKTAETINIACSELGTTKAELAKRMGMLPSSLYRKLARESMTFEEFQKCLVKTVKFRLVMNQNRPAEMIEASQRRMMKALFQSLKKRHPLIQGYLDAPRSQVKEKFNEHSFRSPYLLSSWRRRTSKSLSFFSSTPAYGILSVIVSAETPPY